MSSERGSRWSASFKGQVLATSLSMNRKHVRDVLGLKLRLLPPMVPGMIALIAMAAAFMLVARG
jgi:hypothetical protein